ncbi:unnamed protein product, partial [Tetraodon nigroviridis]
MSVISEEKVRGENVFKDLSAEDWEPTEIESMCMNCHQDGTTRLLLTKIPFFKEIIVSSFSCPHCQWANTEIQSAGRIQDQGVCYTLQVRTKEDLNREVVKADSATTRIPQLDFEIPAFTQKGCLSTVEGILERAAAGLEQDQAARRAAEPQLAEKIQEFIRSSGGAEAGCLSTVEGILERAAAGLEQDQAARRAADPSWLRRSRKCNAAASTNMKLVQIPHFKEVIIMATSCDSCGHRTNEVKSGGATEAMGTRISLHVTDVSDMSRDVLKSETCSVAIPELDFELGMAIVGGKFTTLEGLLKDIKELVVSRNPFVCGDSGGADRLQKLAQFGQKLDRIMAGEMDVHLVLDDPAGNSYLQNVYAPEPDPEMSVEKYTRSFQQNEDLGLNDMKTEDY